MIPIRTVHVLLVGALLALTACGRPTSPIQVPPPVDGGTTPPATTPPGTTPPGTNPPGTTPPGTTPPGTTPPATTPPAAQPGAHIAIPQGKSAAMTFPLHDQQVNLTASLNPQAMTISGLPGAPIRLDNPLGDMAEGTLDRFQVGGEVHLLATLTNGRNVLLWVLVPGQNATAIALQKEVDWGAGVEGERVKASWRKYKPEGGFVITSDYYQYNPQTKKYEKAPA